jgi:hypothetical protein
MGDIPRDKSPGRFASTAKATDEAQTNEAFEKQEHRFGDNDSPCNVAAGIIVEIINEGRMRVRRDVNGIGEMFRRIRELFTDEDAKS